MTDMTNHQLPADTTILTPAEGQPLEIGFGYIAETSADVIFLTLRDPRHGTYTVVLTPAIAADAAETIRVRCDKLARLRATEQNGDNDHDHQ